MDHKVYLRLPPLARLASDQDPGSVRIECPSESLDELCKWLRLTADSLDGKLSASELGHLRDVAEQEVDAKTRVSAVAVCLRFAQEHPEHSAAARQIGKLIAQGARR